MQLNGKRYRKTNFLVPIFNQRVYILIFSELNDVRSLYTIDEAVDLTNRDAVVFEYNSGEIIAFQTSISNGLLAHECLHVVRRIMKKIGIKNITMDDNELECYLLGYLVDKISKWFTILENEK